MKTFWKWIIGIVIVLVVVGLVVGAVLILRPLFLVSMRSTPFAYRQNQPSAPSIPSSPQNKQNIPSLPTAPNPPNIPNLPNVTTPNSGGQMPNRGLGWGYPGPMMGRGYNQSGRSGSSGIMGFMFLGLVGLIVLLAALAAAAFIFYQLGKNAGISSMLLAQQASNAPAIADTDPPAKAGRARKTA
jgi:hypothetical protein